MAFKKREYNHWVKFFDYMLYKSGCDPYLIKKWVTELGNEDRFEEAKAAKDVFDKWFEKYQMTKEQVDKRFSDHWDKVYDRKKIN